MKNFLKSIVKNCKKFCSVGGFPLAPEGGPTLTKGRFGSLSELDRIRNSEHSFYSFEIKHVSSLEIYG
jgi:hypothetical protein